MQDNLTPWDAVNVSEHPDNQTQLRIMRDTARKFKQVFETDEGQWVINYLNARYFNHKVVDESATNVLAKAGIREGEMRVLRFIHSQLGYKD